MSCGTGCGCCPKCGCHVRCTCNKRHDDYPATAGGQVAFHVRLLTQFLEQLKLFS